MKTKIIRVSQLLCSFLLLVAFLFGAAGERGGAIAAPQASTAGAEVQAGEISAQLDDGGQGWRAATQPWTIERMQAATPGDVIDVEGVPTYSLETTQADVPSGSFPSALPEDAQVVPSPLEGLDLVSFAAPLGYSYPAPFTRYEHFQPYTIFPYSTTGVLFYSMDGSDFRCTAASIGNNAIWTAGHCVHNGSGSSSGWATDVVFIPAYKNGAAPYGIWTAEDVWTRNEWYASKDLRFDMGGAVLNVNGSGHMISQVVGSLGFLYGQTRSQHWTDLGYPAASPFSGKYLDICSASHAYDDTAYGAPQPMGIGCDLTGGSSGGPWITKFSGVSGSANYLNGHNSYRYTSHPQEMFSPYFGSQAQSLWYTLVNYGIPKLSLPMILNGQLGE